jgi:hypothetical protein
LTIFNAWASADRDDEYRAQQSIARGQELFNTKPIVLTGVARIRRGRD